jgi:hypothetical protein
LDVWKAGAPSIDFLSPIFIIPVCRWCMQYHQAGNRFLFPNHGGTNNAPCFYAVRKAWCHRFSPFH